MQLSKYLFLSIVSLSVGISAEEPFINLEKTDSSLVIEKSSKDVSGREKLLSLVAGEWIAKSLYVAAELDLASYLANGPKTAKELSKLTRCDEENLYRLMRLLASVGVFREGENRHFSNTEASALLTKEHPESLHNLIVFYSKEMSQSFDHLLECVSEGTPAFNITFNGPVFSYFRKHPESAYLFNAAMREKSGAVIASCLKSYDFSKFSSVYDIGGGTGHFLSALLSKFPNMHGMLFELPHVIEQARGSLASNQRCSLVFGDFFTSIPDGGNAYLLKSVLHDFNDEITAKILTKCHAAMNNQSSLIIIEPILHEANKPEYTKAMDVYMMAITGGKERSLVDFKRILGESGFVIETITPTETEFSIIEARKK